MLYNLCQIFIDFFTKNVYKQKYSVALKKICDNINKVSTTLKYSNVILKKNWDKTNDTHIWI